MLRRLAVLSAVAGAVVASAPQASAYACVNATSLGVPAWACYIDGGGYHHCVAGGLEPHTQNVCAGCYRPDGWVIYVSISNNVGTEIFSVPSPVSCSPR